MIKEKIIVGIDIGGSTTKICGYRFPKNELIQPLFIKASDQIASIYGAFGKFCSDNAIELSEIEKIIVTGVGSSFITSPIYGIPIESVAEFMAIGLGGLYLSGLERAIVVSMGTGTAIVKADKSGCVYLGGTGVGGGTVMGLSRKLLNMDNIENITDLAAEGTIGNVDLQIGHITKKDIIPGMPSHMTASNFGRLSDIATNADIALGIFNMVFETIGMMSIFAARQYGISDIVLTGNLTEIPQSKKIFESLKNMFKINFIIPELSQFGPVIGSALTYRA